MTDIPLPPEIKKVTKSKATKKTLKNKVQKAKKIVHLSSNSDDEGPPNISPPFSPDSDFMT